MELVNCPNCNAIFEKNKFRDVCAEVLEKRRGRLSNRI